MTFASAAVTLVAAPLRPDPEEAPDEVDLVPVVMGGGRPYFGDRSVDDVALGNPTACVASDRVVHLTFSARSG